MKIFSIGEFRISIGRVGKVVGDPSPPLRMTTLKNTELANVFAVPDTTPWWRAVLQVIDTTREVAHKGAEEMSGINNQACAHLASGAAHLTMLRKQLTDLRDQALNRRG